ncbi:hypothetical protein [Flavobacterium sp. NRK1]|uniref:hypothetical protein n=1 Tax=Flavobacterium sp. NRK1 TaxID=2954929 RepID=UPI00209369BF|nr:hypothetical protein [Flavobacterium sp. NRK1]MCO6147912.1 hypothetical protein [Flavobacterium sp. NRK1]
MKKKINILLIVVVGGLWGTVGYRFINNYFFNNTVNNITVGKTAYTTKLVTQRDTFLLENMNRDPFLNKMVSVATTEITSKRNTGNIKKHTTFMKPVAIPKYWPEIQYHGYMKSGKSNEVALLKINGQLLKLHKGESKENLTIQNVYKDSVAVVFNREKKVFKRI